MTKEQLEAENARLGEENAALRELLAAASAAADLPLAVSADGVMKRRVLGVQRADYVASFCRMDKDAVDVVSVLRNRATVLRDLAAAPLSYEAEDDELHAGPVAELRHGAFGDGPDCGCGLGAARCRELEDGGAS